MVYENGDMRDWSTLIQAHFTQKRHLCVGLDPDLSKIPAHITGSIEERISTFNRSIIDATKDVVCAFKPNSAFYEAHGAHGLQILKDTCDYIRYTAPEVPIILDAKRGDIGNTNDGYVAMAFDWLGVDAITVHPYMGKESLAPFLARKNKGIIVLCKTSNEGSGEFQNIDIGIEKMYQKVARAVVAEWNANENCALVVGATYPEELRRVREIAPEIPLLTPGVGSQGGDLAASVTAAGGNFILNVGRLIMYAQNPRAAARGYDSAIRTVLV